jgi:sugar phosphate isomerase/epimerase
MAEFILSAFADEAAESLDEQIAALKDNGIRFIEPRCIDGRPILDFSEQELGEIKKRFDRSGIKVSSLGSPIGKYPITDDFESYKDTFFKAIKAAKILDTKFIRIFSFFTKQDELSIYRDEVISRLNFMTAAASAEGITLCHENESAIYAQMPEQVLDILTNVKDLGGIFDAANYRINGADVIKGIEATLTNFKYIHVKDAIYKEQMIVPAGEGEGKIAEVINLVDKKIDNTVFLSVEPHLMSFVAYKSIDTHELKGKYSFTSNREAFDFATNALKKLLTEEGYKEDNLGIWKR